MLRPRSDAPRTSSGLQSFEFVTDKYGGELLVDVGSTSELPGFQFHRRAHRLLFYDVLLLRTGHGRLLQDDRWHPVKAGDAIFLAPGEIRRWALSGDAEGLVLFFTGEFLRSFLRDDEFLDTLPFFTFGGPRVLELTVGAAATVERRLLAMRSEIRGRSWGRRMSLEASAYRVLIDLGRESVAQGYEVSGSPSPAWLERLSQAIERDFHRHLPAAHYAEHCGLSLSHLRNKIREATGRSLRQLLRERILMEAKRQLLHTESTVAEIAAHCGYGDPSHFGRVFRREMGCSPLDYRQAARSR